MKACTAAALAALLLPAAAFAGGEAPPVRNVLLVSIDSLRADHLALYGYPRETTPDLDRAARERGATVYERLTAAAPACHPSHTAMLTGLYPQQVGVPGCAEDLVVTPEDLTSEQWTASLNEEQRELQSQPPALVRKRLSAVMNWLAIPEGTETLATYLQRHGFHTGGFTSIWTVEHRFGYARGFDVFVDRMPEYYGPPQLSWLLADLMRGQRRQVGEVTVDGALDYLNSLAPDDRFFVFVHLADTHVPYAPRSVPPFAETPAERARLEAVWRARYSPDTYERAMQRMGHGTPDFLLDLYDRAIRYDDEQVARLFDWLARHHRFDDTLVVVVSDHGDGMGQHFYLSRTHHDRLFFEHTLAVWEETEHVPLLIFDPAHRGPLTRDGANASHVDLVPTILDRLGLPTADFGSGRLPGRSLSQPEEEDHIVFFLTFGRGRPGLLRHLELDFPKFIGFRSGDSKFFVDRERFRHPDAGRCFLFDLATDPDELHNLCTGATAAAKAGPYRSVLVDWYSGAARARQESKKPTKPTPSPAAPPPR